jgi:MoxR-like ATPase
MDTKRFSDYRDAVVENCSKVIVGKEDVIQLVLTCFICSGHVLLEDVPGTGKTMLLRAFSKTIGGDFKRIQFTPDLLPSDLTGINFFDQKENDFRFRPGPLFTNIILADEVNRATPRTQSALLEAMEEQQISVDGTTYTLKEPFMVMATQNPIESYGTFPLPEAQLDRFFMRISMGYMTREQELTVISRTSTIDIIESLRQVVSSEDTQYIKNNFHQVQVCPDVAGYIMDIIQSTREESKFVTGVSTRGAICLYKAAQVTAALSGRDFVTPEDVRFVAPYVLCHRISSGFSTKFHDTEAFLKKLIDTIPVPVENIK